MNRHLAGLAAAMIGATASAATAHYSHPYFYDQCKSVTIEGRVERVEWKDPHTLVFLKLDEGTAYTVDWNGLSQLARGGTIDAAKAALVLGARVSVVFVALMSAGSLQAHHSLATLDTTKAVRVTGRVVQFHQIVERPVECHSERAGFCADQIPPE